MSTLLASLAAIAALDSINPNAMAVQLYLLSTPKPVARSIAFILGDFFAAWVAGLLIAFGMTQVLAQIFNRLGEVIYVLQLIGGVILIILGYNLDKFASPQIPTKRPKSLKPIHTFLLGATMAFVEAPTALPYLAALERMTSANLPLQQLMGVLTFYNVIFVFPLFVLLGIYLLLGDRAADLLDRINPLITKWFPKIMRVILIGLGFLLILDCIAYPLGYSFL
jgi:cytochrome c biogenesis protein CcdA